MDFNVVKNTFTYWHLDSIIMFVSVIKKVFTSHTTYFSNKKRSNIDSKTQAMNNFVKNKRFRLGDSHAPKEDFCCKVMCRTFGSSLIGKGVEYLKIVFSVDRLLGLQKFACFLS